MQFPAVRCSTSFLCLAGLLRLPGIVLLALPHQAQRLVRIDLLHHAVASCANGNGQHDAEWDQLRWDLLESSDALGDGVGCGSVSLRSVEVAEYQGEDTGVLFFLRPC